MSIDIRKNVIRFLMYFNFLFPTFDSVDIGVDFAYGSIIIHAVITCVCILTLLTTRSRNSKYMKSGIMFFCFFLMVIISSTVFSPNTVVFRDLFEVHRPFYYGSVFLLAVSTDFSGEELSKYIAKPLMICLSVLLFMELRIFIPEPLIKSIRSLYTKAWNVKTGRATGTLGNPYDYGFIMILFLNMAVYNVIANISNKSKIVMPLLSVTLLILSFFVIFSSQSRTIFLLLPFALVYGVLKIYLTDKRKTVRLRLLLLAALGSLLVIAAFSVFMRYIQQNFRYLYSVTNLFTSEDGVYSIGSSRVRIEQMIFSIEELLKRPIFGFGPSKSAYENLETQYALYLYRYGLSGLSIMLVYFSAAVYFSSKALRKVYSMYRHTKNRNLLPLFFGFHVWCAILPIASVGSAFIDKTRISFVFFLLCGVCVSLCRDGRERFLVREVLSKTQRGRLLEVY